MSGIVRLLSIAGLGLVLATAAASSASADGWREWNQGNQWKYNHGHKWKHDQGYKRNYYYGNQWKYNQGHKWKYDHEDNYRSNFFLGLNFWSPPPSYSAPAYYAPPPNVVYTAPPPPPPSCVQVNGGAIVDATGQPFYGIACLGGDGRWHIAN